jgi:hypothetical protein
VTALSLPNGSVRLYLELPGAGNLTVAAESAVRLLASHARSTARHGRSSAHRARVSATVVERKVAAAHEAVGAGAGAGGLMELTLTLSSSYRVLASRSGGLSSSVSVVFAAPGHATLRQSIAVSFHSKAKAARARPSKRAPKVHQR